LHGAHPGEPFTTFLSAVDYPPLVKETVSAWNTRADSIRTPTSCRKSVSNMQAFSRVCGFHTSPGKS
jgi:hypothetical protein